MIKVKVKSNEELFNRFKALSMRIRTLGSIMQNETEISDAEIDEWIELTQEQIKELNELQIEVLKEITKFNRKDSF